MLEEAQQNEVGDGPATEKQITQDDQVDGGYG
jgi:hypothetical protein